MIVSDFLFSLSPTIVAHLLLFGYLHTSGSTVPNQVEMLYQRYFLRMNQSNTTHILSLLLALVLCLAVLHVLFIPVDGGIKLPLLPIDHSINMLGQNHSSIIFQNNGSESITTKKGLWNNTRYDAKLNIHNRTNEMINHSYYMTTENDQHTGLISNSHLKNYSGRGAKRRKRQWFDGATGLYAHDMTMTRKQFKTYVKWK